MDSHVYTGSDNNGMCTIYSIGVDDNAHPNTVQVRVQIPHTDSMFPVVSTKPLSNLEYTLNRHGYRPGTHSCSNLVHGRDQRTQFGFLRDESVDSYISLELNPYQNSEELRSTEATMFYK